MEIDPQLLLINILTSFVIISSLTLGLLIFFSKKNTTELRCIFLFLSLTISVFLFSFIFSLNNKDPDLAFLLFSFSSVVFFIGPLLLHSISAGFSFSRRKYKSLILLFFYGYALVFNLAFFLFPRYFIQTPESNGFFQNFFLAGDLFYLTLFFWVPVFVISLVMLGMAYVRARKQENTVGENKIVYALIAIIIAFFFGSFLWPMAYGIDIDPKWFFFFGLFMIPLSYGVLSKKVAKIIVVSKFVLIFIIFTIFLTILFIGVVILNNFLGEIILGFPIWLIPAVVSSLCVLTLMYFRHSIVNMQILKYEFISVITHKFRTPLTRIKWSVQMLEGSETEEDKQVAIKEIASSAQKLVDLTDVLVDASKMEGIAYEYKFDIKNLNSIVDRVYESAKKDMDDKRISYDHYYDDSFSKIFADEQRLQLALQILFENATNYTPKEGSISVRISKDDDMIVFSITDTGIGITVKEQEFLFSKFYRSKRAKLADPNGMGIGVFMAQKIIERHEGRMWATSAGPNCGSTFWVSFPNASH